MLGKCRKECAEAVWKTNPKSIPEAIATMCNWEHRNGHPAKPWFSKFDGQWEKKPDYLSQKVVKINLTPSVVGGAVQVKIEKPWNQQRYTAQGTATNVTSVVRLVT